MKMSKYEIACFRILYIDSKGTNVTLMSFLRLFTQTITPEIITPELHDKYCQN